MTTLPVAVQNISRLLGTPPKLKNFLHFFKGNKNKTRKKLGFTTSSIGSNCVDNSVCLEGNKNKTGNKSGTTTQLQFHTNLQDSLQFRGNKNGPRAKLSVLPSQYSQGMNDIPCQVVNASCVRTTNERTNRIQSALEFHELSCMKHTQTDDTCLLYDVAGRTTIRKRNILEIIHNNKYNSFNNNHCVQQNGKKKLGFLPLNDLMVYKGEEVVWSDIPDIIEAHKIVRSSARSQLYGSQNSS